MFFFNFYINGHALNATASSQKKKKKKHPGETPMVPTVTEAKLFH